MRRRSVILAILFAWMAPFGATTLLGCKNYDDLVKEVADSGLPVVTSVVPTSAKVGEVVTLRGANFGAEVGRVGFEDANAIAQRAEVVSWNVDFIVAKVPALTGSPSATKIRMMNSAGKESPLPFDFTISK